MDPPRPEAPRPRVLRPLWRKLALGASAIAVLPALIVGWRVIQVNADVLKADARELQLAVADDIAQRIEIDLGAAQGDLDRVSRALTDTRLAPSARVALALALVAQSRGLDHVVLYDAAGARIDAIVEEGASLVPAPEHLPAALAADAAARGVGFGEVAAWEGENRLTVAVPITGGGKVTGTAMARVSLRPLQRRVESLGLLRFRGLPDAIFVLDREARVVAHVDPAVAASLPSRRGVGAVAGLSGRALTEVAAVGEADDGTGRQVLFSLVPVPERPFAVAIQVPRDVAYEAHDRMLRLVALAVAAAAGLAVVIAIGFARRLTRPISALVDHAAALAAGRFSARTDVRTGDELAVLGDAMNRAAADLAGFEARARHEAAIRADLGRYLAAELVDKIVRREQDMGLGGTRRVVTVLFADVAGFTPIAEKLPAEAVVALLNELFTILTEIVFRHGGTVDKFIGDCVLAMWGAPEATDDHATRALAAAQDMQRWVETGRAAWSQRHGVDVKLAIGVSSGEAIVGNIGSQQRMEYTAVGDTVNIAAHLEKLARPGQIVVTASTRRLAGKGFDFIPCGARELAGRVGEVELYEVAS